MRLWLNNNHSNTKDIDIVIESALNELIYATSESLITLEVLRELSDQLPYVKNTEARKKLLDRFRKIEDDLRDIGMVKVKYVYKLNVFHASLTVNIVNADAQINSIISEVEKIDDILIRLEVYSEIYQKLKIINNVGFSNKINYVHDKIISISDKLFNETANHFKLSQQFIKTISKKNPGLGLKICGRINTVSRRDNARLLVLDSYLNNDQKQINIEVIKQLEKSFELKTNSAGIYIRVLERFSLEKNLHSAIIEELQYFMEKIDDTLVSSENVYGHLLSYKIISKNQVWEKKLSKTIETRIIKSWQNIEADWERIDNGFTICSEVSKFNPEFAMKIFTETENLKKESWLDSRLIAYTYLNCLKLIIRAYSGLIGSQNEEKNDLTILESLINRVPSQPEKLKLWTEIGFNTYLNDRMDILRDVFDTHILPLVQQLIDQKHDFRQDLNSFTIVHLLNTGLAEDYISNLPNELREDAYSRICYFYVSKRSPFEVYDYTSECKYKVTFNDLSKAIAVLDSISTDSHIYDNINKICKSVLDCRDTISRAQITIIAEKLKSVIDLKLPDRKNIKHPGYKLLANAKLFLLKKETTNWSEVLKEINQVPNVSDRIFTKAFILEDIPLKEIKKGMVEDIISELYSIKIHYEFVQRVIDISDVMYKIDRIRWKEIINKAFLFSNEFELGSEIYNSRKNIIDSIYRIDPIFAKELIKSLEINSSTNRIDTLLQEHFDALEIAKKIKNSKTLNEKEFENNKLVVKGILNTLKALNSNKITTKKISEVAHFLALGKKLPLHEIFPIYMYYLTNCAKTYRSKTLEGSVANIHRNNFREAINSTNFIQFLSQRKKVKESVNNNIFVDEAYITNKAIKPRTREEAIGFIKDWIFDEVKDFIIVIDPYFCKEDIELLKFILEKDPSIEIEILGSKDGLKPNLEDEYKSHWTKISDQTPPFTNITFCWYQNDNNTPIHDRWILTKDGGLRLGTSFNSLGKNKESELSIMKPNEALNILESTIKDYIYKKKKEINGQRLAYKSFSL